MLHHHAVNVRMSAQDKLLLLYLTAYDMVMDDVRIAVV